MKFKPLSAVLPSNSVTTLSTRQKHVVVCKYIVETTNLLASLNFVCLALGLSPFISAFSSTHKK